jgi:hypothetical protein
MFDLKRTAEEARRAEKLRGIYHHGQDLAWNGQQVLGALLEKHCGVHVTPAAREALGRVLAAILWGELAAWRVSAQLADAIVPLEPKMAATSQAHDEARHFYVMHDYLAALGYLPTRMGRSSRKLLETVLEERDLTHKLVGMQLMIETIALTIFQALRESKAEPVLAELLTYFEKDEARHVGLGIQYLPDRLKGLTTRRALGLIAYELRIVYFTLSSLASLEQDLATLGIAARDMIRMGKAKQQQAFDAMWSALGLSREDRPLEGIVSRAIDAASEAWFPPARDRRSIYRRLRAARAVWRAGGHGAEGSSVSEVQARVL